MHNSELSLHLNCAIDSPCFFTHGLQSVYIYIYVYMCLIINIFPTNKRSFRGPEGVGGQDLGRQAKICVRELASVASRCLQRASRDLPITTGRTIDIRRPHWIGASEYPCTSHILYPTSHTHILTISFSHILYLISRGDCRPHHQIRLNPTLSSYAILYLLTILIILTSYTILYLLTYFGIYTICLFAHKSLFGAIWSYLELSGAIWSYMVVSAAIWWYLQLSGAI